VIGRRGRNRDYLQSATLGGPQRVRLFGWFWDTVTRPFPVGRRCTSTYFFGDSVRMAGPYVASYDRESHQAAVRAFWTSG